MINARDIAFIECRFVAIYFAFKSIIMIAFIASVFLVPAESSPLYSFLIPFSLFVVLGWVFWSGAGWLSGKIVTGKSVESSADPQWTVNEVVSVAVSLVGFVLLVFTVARIPEMFLSMGEFGHVLVGRYLNITVFLIAEIFMIIQPQGIARLLSKVRRGGIEN